jgi:hypothetical protein
MLLILIAGLSIALVIEHRERELSEQLALAREQRALAEARRAEDLARHVQAQLRKALDEAKNSTPPPTGGAPGRTSAEVGR